MPPEHAKARAKANGTELPTPQVIDGVSMLDPLTGKSWMLGSSMKIQVAAADVALGRIDFEYMVE